MLAAIFDNEDAIRIAVVPFDSGVSASAYIWHVNIMHSALVTTVCANYLRSHILSFSYNGNCTATWLMPKSDDPNPL